MSLNQVKKFLWKVKKSERWLEKKKWRRRNAELLIVEQGE